MAIIYIDPVGCPDGPITVGDQVSFQTIRPTGLSWTAGPYWVGNNTLNGNAYTSTNNPVTGAYAFNPLISEAGDYCFTFEALADDGNTYISECCFTALSESSFIACPTSNLPENTSVSLLLDTAGIPSAATNVTYNVLSGGGGVSGNTYTNPNPITGLNSVTIERCYDIAGSLDKRTNLLNSPDRTGYGAAATGGTNYVFPNNEAELRQMAAVDGNYVCLDNLSGQVGLRDGIDVGSNITIDGSNTDVTFFPDYAAGFPSAAAGNASQALVNVFSEDNVILHCFALDGRRSATYSSTDPSYNAGGVNLRGTNIWFDHVEVTRFWDDGLLIARQGNFITVSNYKATNTDKGILLYYPDDPNKNVTVHSSYLAATQRNPWNTNAENFHMYNNYMTGALYGATSIGRLSSSGAFSASAPNSIDSISENNVWEGNATSGGGNPHSARTHNDGYIDGNLFTYNDSFDVPPTGSITYGGAYPWTIPYTYSLLPTAEVKSYVEANAGAIDKANTSTGGTTCETATCSYTVVSSTVECDCSGLPNVWPVTGSCGVPMTISYTLPAGATSITAGTNITGGSVSNVTATSLQLTVVCGGTGTTLSGVVQVRYILDGVLEQCLCNTTVSVLDSDTMVPECDCSGLPNVWPVTGTCGVPMTINYTLPAGAVLAASAGGTNIPNGSVSNITTTSAIVNVLCTGSGNPVSGVVQIRYTLGSLNCACNTTITFNDPEVMPDACSITVTHGLGANIGTVCIINTSSTSTEVFATTAGTYTSLPATFAAGEVRYIPKPSDAEVVNGMKNYCFDCR